MTSRLYEAYEAVDNQVDEMKEAIHRTFNTPDGKSVLAWILNECGFFATRPEDVKPELFAFGNRLLQRGGMTLEGDMGAFMDACLASYEGEERNH